jgi:ubiquitin-protein ligase
MLEIEIKLTSKYTKEAPGVRFLTSVYHPNVEMGGKPMNIFKESKVTTSIYFFL